MCFLEKKKTTWKKKWKYFENNDFSWTADIILRSVETQILSVKMGINVLLAQTDFFFEGRKLFKSPSYRGPPSV